MAADVLRVRVGITNSFVLRERGTVVVDPGGPPGSRAALRRILHHLGTPPRLDLIVVTHGHFDHREAAGRLRDATGAPVAVHRADLSLLDGGVPTWPRGVTPWGRMLRAALGPLVATFRAASLEPDLLLDDDGLDLARYGVTGHVVHTPGHTRGSVSVVLSSGQAMVGDLAMNRLPLCWRPSFGIFAEEPERHRASWHRLVELGVRTAYPAHGRPFVVSTLG
jgi:hydroxyacylglutathione hydrolase